LLDLERRFGPPAGETRSCSRPYEAVEGCLSVENAGAVANLAAIEKQILE
jgi:hypothetical protein